MRILAITFNVVLIMTMAALLIDDGIPRRADDILLVALVTAAPILSLLALTVASSREDWLGLYVRRKALEERRRIEALEKDRK